MTTEGHSTNDRLRRSISVPIARDFRAAFALNGADDKPIAAVNEGGLAPAAMQQLNQRFEVTEKAVKTRDGEIQNWKQQLDALEHIPLKQESN